jgi:hypothetical protein
VDRCRRPPILRESSVLTKSPTGAQSGPCFPDVFEDLFDRLDYADLRLRRHSCTPYSCLARGLTNPRRSNGRVSAHKGAEMSGGHGQEAVVRGSRRLPRACHRDRVATGRATRPSLAGHRPGRRPVVGSLYPPARYARARGAEDGSGAPHSPARGRLSGCPARASAVTVGGTPGRGTPLG